MISLHLASHIVHDIHPRIHLRQGDQAGVEGGSVEDRDGRFAIEPAASFAGIDDQPTFGAFDLSAV